MNLILAYRFFLKSRHLSPCFNDILYRLHIDIYINMIYFRVVVGENVNFSSFAEKIMREQGVKVVLAQDPHCIQMMKTFIEGNNNLWKEDVHEIE